MFVKFHNQMGATRINIHNLTMWKNINRWG